MARTAANVRKKGVRATPPPQRATPNWIIASVLFVAALILAFIVYAPALNGDFVFDDRGLPMFQTNAATLPLRAWLHVRPLLMATYYANFHLSGLDPSAYHSLNVILHAACAVLIFFAVRRLLEMAGIEERRRLIPALFGAALFLLHPVQTEAVSYVASRSETLSVLLFLAAFNVFLYRRETDVTWRTSLIILVLYGAAMSCKEHTAMLPAALLLTDYFFGAPRFSTVGIKRNWRLYAPIGVAALAGFLFIASYINPSSNAGLGIKNLTPFDYLLTQFRAIFVYLRLFLLPVDQSADYNFAISRGLLEHGAIFYGITLLALVGAAVFYRKRAPLAVYGFLLFLILLAPTSSFLPIKDALAERRLYLPFIGLVLITSDAILRMRWSRQTGTAVMAGICVLLSVATFRRNQVWTGMETLWRDVVAKDPGNVRAVMGLADAYALRGQCVEAIPYFERAQKLEPGDYKNTYNLASAYDCVNQNGPAMAWYRKALALKPTAESWTHIAMLQMKSAQFDDAYKSLDQALKLDSAYLLAFDYRGILDLAMSRFDEAAVEFQNVLNVSPADQMALRGMDRAHRHERQF